LNTPGDYHLGKRLIHSQFQVGIGLVVLEIDVITRLVFFGERGFEDQRFNFAVCHNELDVDDIPQQRIGLPIKGSRLKVGTHAVAQVLGLADIDRLARHVFVEIDAGRSRNLFQFFFESHADIDAVWASVIF
jgi:hypothetical protein